MTRELLSGLGSLNCGVLLGFHICGAEMFLSGSSVLQLLCNMWMNMGLVE